MSVNWKLRGPDSTIHSGVVSLTGREDSIFDSGAPMGLREIHENMASLERAVYEEAERRVASEDRIREQVDTKVRIAIERLGDATEMEMTRMYRRIDADLMNRLDQVTREMNSVSSLVKQLNRQIELVTVETRENRDNLARMERRLGSSSGPVDDVHKRELGKLKEMIESDLDNSKRIDQIDNYVNTKLTNRVEVMEGWLKSSLTPEMLRLKELLAAEKINRESNDQSIMDIVSEYTDIMRRHFSSKEEAAPQQSDGESEFSRRTIKRGNPESVVAYKHDNYLNCFVLYLFVCSYMRTSVIAT